MGLGRVVLHFASHMILTALSIEDRIELSKDFLST